jgi:hypothetical protein
VAQEQLQLDKWTFFTIGIILFLVGSVASFFAHDDSNEFLTVYKKYHKEEEAFWVLQKEVSDKRVAEKENFDTQRKRIQKEYSENTADLKNKLHELRTQKTEVAGSYNKILTICKGMERKINSHFQEAIYNYRDTNLMYRNNHKQPKSWSEIVPALQNHFTGLKELS